MRSDPTLGAVVGNAELTPAWRWRLEPRWYAVIVLRFKMASSCGTTEEIT
jgi:hypothetical protein